VRRLIQELKFLTLIFAFLFLTDYATISFASEITNFALFSYKIGGIPKQISTDLTSTTLNIPSGATIIAPQNNYVVPQNFTVIGTAPADAQVEMKIDGVTQYSLTSDSNGYYSQDVSVTPGSHTITIYANGIEGESVEVEVVSGLPLNYPEIESPEDGAKITNRRPQLIGKATANCPISVYAKASPIKIVGVGSSNSSGDFTITLNQDLSSGKTQLFVMDTTNNLSSEVHEVTFIDPEGVVFDSVTNSPINGAQVTLYNATTNLPCVPGVEIDASDTNPYLTGTDGYYMFNAIDGNYYLRVSVAGYTFPSTLSSFPRTITTGSKGELFTIAGVALTINLPVDATSVALSVTPADGLNASGTEGGPFSPSSKTYTLTNTGGSSINWTASNVQTWVSLSSTGSSLAPGESTTVTVSISSDANRFTPGNYIDTVTFTNMTDGNGNTTRPVSLTVTGICVYWISPTSRSHSYVTETGSISVTASSGCPWAATSNESWITITSGSNGTGNGTVNYSVSANTSLSSRTGTINIEGYIFMVYQAGVSCTHSISPTTQYFGVSGGTGSVTISTQSGCTWTATSIESWIAITSGTSGTGNGTVNYSVSANTSTSSRTGTMIIAGEMFIVIQEEGVGECSTWDDVITKYQAYVDGQASWDDVVACYEEAVGCEGECSTWDDVITKYQAFVDGQVSWDDVVACYEEMVECEGETMAWE